MRKSETMSKNKCGIDDFFNVLASFVQDYNNIEMLRARRMESYRQIEILHIAIQKLESFYCSSLAMHQHETTLEMMRTKDVIAELRNYNKQFANDINQELLSITFPEKIFYRLHNSYDQFVHKSYSKRRFFRVYNVLWEALNEATIKLKELDDRITAVEEQKRAWQEVRNIIKKEVE